MPCGNSLSEAFSAATDAAKATARKTVQSIVAVQQAATDAAASAAKVAAKATADAARATAEAAVKTSKAVGSAVVETGKHGLAAGLLAGEALLGASAYVVGKTASNVKQVADSAYDAVRPLFDPYEEVNSPCVKCLNKDNASTRKARIDKRNELITTAKATGNHGAATNAALLAQDMEAVEMGRLANDLYNDDNASSPPEPWTAMKAEDLKEKGIKPKALADAKARVYQLDADFPGGPKTVLAFKGTVPAFDDEVDLNDLVTNHDQALGHETRQYEAAKALGRQVAKAYPKAEVTGHSLGGGKAQAAGAMGGLKGIMFNAAGLHPETVRRVNLNSLDKNFVQYRASGGASALGGDPLSGMQNSPTAQAALVNSIAANTWAANRLGAERISPDNAVKAALMTRTLNTSVNDARKNREKYGYYLPPARGRIVDTPSKTADGKDVGADPGGQHSMTNLINGIETRKYATVSSLLQQTGILQGKAQDYLGPTEVRLQ